MKKMIAVVLCLVLALSLVACAAKEVGRYDLVSMSQDGVTINIDEYAEMMGEDVEMYLELKADGTGVMSVLGETVDMGWGGGKIWPASDKDDTVTYELDGTTLTLEQDGMSMVFEKQ